MSDSPVEHIRRGVRVVTGRAVRGATVTAVTTPGDRAVAAIRAGRPVAAGDFAALALTVGTGRYTPPPPPPPPPVPPPSIADNAAVNAALKLKDGDVAGAVGSIAAGAGREAWTALLNIIDGPRLLYYWATDQPEKALELKRKAWDRGAQKWGSDLAGKMLGPRP